MPRLIPSLVFVILLLGSLYAWGQQPLFRQVPSKESNISFENTLDDKENLNVMAYEYFYNGGGVAVGDLNNDGLEDLFLTSNMSENRLYLNQGGLRFKDITKAASKELLGRKGGWKTGVTMADVNGDGLLDIYICYSGKVEEALRKNQLFINQGVKGGVVQFEEQAEKYGLASSSYSTQAAFLDYDRDGDLDMLLLNHSVKKIDNMELAKFRQQTDEWAGNKLFENKGGNFVDVSEAAGIHQYPLTFGLGVAVADVDMDGWPDMYVTNDYNESDYLYINQRNGTFKDVTKQYFRHLAQFSMGVDIADFNNDGLPDLMSLDMLPEDNRRQKLLQLQENYEAFELMLRQDLHQQFMRNMLQLNNGDGTFSEIAQLAGVSNTDWSWSPLLADFDNDGYKDLFVSNGYYRDYTNKDFLRYWGDYKIRKAIDREPVHLLDLVNAMPSTRLSNYIFKNNRDLTFSKMQQDWGLDQAAVSAGAIYADLDNDGDLDLVVNNINEPASLYENRHNENTHHYIQFRLQQPTGNINALGAKVYLYADGKMQYQEVSPTRGYLSAVSTRIHFGMGAYHQSIDSVRVVWPDGAEQRLVNLALDQLHTIEKKDAGHRKERLSSPSMSSLLEPVDGLFPYTHVALDENDFKRQPLMLSMYSQVGPVMAQGDINNDGLADIYISGHLESRGNIWMQRPDGTFDKLADFNIGDENSSAQSAAVFFDANGDGYDDLYIAKGGYSFYTAGSLALQDELYINNQKGGLELSVLSLPNLKASSKSCVRPVDFDLDGDMDLFVGGRIIPGRYPESPTSFLLINDGKGTFQVGEVPFSHIGMVTDAQWADINGDSRPDLVLCGEYMPIKIYLNTQEGFKDATLQYFDKEPEGLWSTLYLADVNGDQMVDIFAGNFGLNSQIRATEEEPAELVYGDFDENGSLDPFFSFYIQGKPYPFVSRDELNDQIFGMRKKFRSYQAYADANIQDILDEEQRQRAKVLKINTLETSLFIQKNGKLIKQKLPIQAQFAPVTNLLYKDIDSDGIKDFLLLGNKSANRLKIGAVDANYGFVLKGHDDGRFEYISQPKVGLSVLGDVKSVLQVPVGKKEVIFIGAFDKPLQGYRVR
ncbi:VCBS repeat-containing protein [Dyadobacter jejuensis]|nr:VCBS repeat-containing protein [Dyadobacter jejuensis]